mmetsp:Transcript_22237/g.27490  ORF Transcript_22237/g.27490 Transcript_22237/m.27490 type:complete len:90 (-) Transcript_22237:1116-1385(-)
MSTNKIFELILFMYQYKIAANSLGMVPDSSSLLFPTLLRQIDTFSTSQIPNYSTLYSHKYQKSNSSKVDIFNPPYLNSKWHSDKLEPNI